ncbi:enoyl-CoA hydratase/isomerase family protein [Sphingobacterium hungaricum]|uniref:Enoyl-CoA hydratase/isomerase family protein n=1 Tax=Sphingobacterium hungaricum TaxID=2082723 RepID=A0A928UUF6_9SPHI|nr:enoyl-CoA hydratase-related protein [Sphingobacterium hungaricum]MBE8712942.1 enoyl-CoA hydratase/isomerase family protein [Sphingobacterium hungaricum]
MTYNFIKTKLDGHVFELILARPEKRNAFTPTMVNEVAHAVSGANSNQQVYLVLIKAEGSVFCAGMDLKAFEDPTQDQLNPLIQNKDLSLGEVLDKLNKPSIAIIEGDVLAGGFLIALSATFILAKKEVRFSLPEVKLGIFPFQVMESLLKYLPERLALQICLSGEVLSCSKAKELGIVYDFLEEDTLSIHIHQLLQNSPFAMQKGIIAVKEQREIPTQDKYNFLLAKLNELKDSKDAKEGISAWKEKRKPDWKNE